MVSALLLAVTLACAAPGDDGDGGAPSAGAALFQRGRTAYDEVRLRDAAILFRDAADVADSDVERHEALLWAGVAAGQAGELSIARRAFDDALRLRCADALPATVSPKVAAVFTEALSTRHPRGCPPPTAATPPTTPTTSAPTTTTEETATPPRTGPASPAPPTPATVEDGLPSPLGLALVGMGGAGVAVAAGIALKGAFDIATAADVRTPQVEARARLDDGNLALGIAALAGLASGAGLAGGVFVLVADGADE